MTDIILSDGIELSIEDLGTKVELILHEVDVNLFRIEMSKAEATQLRDALTLAIG